MYFEIDVNSSRECHGDRITEVTEYSTRLFADGFESKYLCQSSTKPTASTGYGNPQSLRRHNIMVSSPTKR
jgi:hypothetical protein